MRKSYLHHTENTEKHKENYFFTHKTMKKKERVLKIFFGH